MTSGVTIGSDGDAKNSINAPARCQPRAVNECLSTAPASFTPNGGGFSGSFSACRISMIINGGIAHPFRPAPLNSFENHDSVIVARHGIDTARQSSPHGRGVGFVPSRIVMRPVVNKPLLACKL